MKRFTATEKWSDQWFRKLKPEHKIFWQYLCDQCDLAGVWKVDIEAASFYIGTPLSEPEIKEAFGSRVQDIGRGRWWLPGFILFQYGKLSKDCQFHLKVFKSLESHRLMALWEAYLLDRTDEDTTTPPTPPATGVAIERERGIGRGVGGKESEENQPPVDFPKNFPPDEGAAVKTFPVATGIPEDFIRLCWHEAASRGGRDMGGQPVMFFVSYVKRRFEGEKSKKAERSVNGQRGNRPPTIHELKTRREILETQLNTLRNKYGTGPMAKPWSDADKTKRDEIKKQIAECVDQIAKG